MAIMAQPQKTNWTKYIKWQALIFSTVMTVITKARLDAYSGKKQKQTKNNLPSVTQSHCSPVAVWKEDFLKLASSISNLEGWKDYLQLEQLLPCKHLEEVQNYITIFQEDLRFFRWYKKTEHFTDACSLQLDITPPFALPVIWSAASNYSSQACLSHFFTLQYVFLKEL